ncbi:hypothetical protein SmJEL517_g01026 [Synchytrium microbalum]|uniref:Uncharacterized protein n=1 Tax=Synchytrium microbalum TaxID=1806994 RepID=A0A507CBH6_9FUNG|nr:uncharacterized protein SmJEL517_g01026 [Synchytrium microbalum]TPX36972.1 hypothetical protein SmJEL517_g01026 [Synchytrium microbalum]
MADREDGEISDEGEQMTSAGGGIRRTTLNKNKQQRTPLDIPRGGRGPSDSYRPDMDSRGLSGLPPRGRGKTSPRKGDRKNSSEPIKRLSPPPPRTRSPQKAAVVPPARKSPAKDSKASKKYAKKQQQRQNQQQNHHLPTFEPLFHQQYPPFHTKLPTPMFPQPNNGFMAPHPSINAVYEAFPVLAQLVSLGRNSPAQYDLCLVDLDVFMGAREAIRALASSWAMTAENISHWVGIDADIVLGALEEPGGPIPENINDLQPNALGEEYAGQFALESSGVKITEILDDESPTIATGTTTTSTTAKAREDSIMDIDSEEAEVQWKQITQHNATQKPQPPIASTPSFHPPIPSRPSAIQMNDYTYGGRNRAPSPGGNYVLDLSDSDSSEEDSDNPPALKEPSVKAPARKPTSSNSMNSNTASNPQIQVKLTQTEREMEMMRQRIKALEDARARKATRLSKKDSEDSIISKSGGMVGEAVLTTKKTTVETVVDPEGSPSISAKADTDDAMDTDSSTEESPSALKEVASTIVKEIMQEVVVVAQKPAVNQPATVLEATAASLSSPLNTVVFSSSPKLSKSADKSASSPSPPINQTVDKPVPPGHSSKLSSPSQVTKAVAPAKSSASASPAYLLVIRKKLELELSNAEEEIAGLTKKGTEYQVIVNKAKAELATHATHVSEWSDQLGRIESKRQELAAELERLANEEAELRSKMVEGDAIKEKLNRQLISLRNDEVALMTKRQTLQLAINGNRLKLLEMAKSPPQPPVPSSSQQPQSTGSSSLKRTAATKEAANPKRQRPARDTEKTRFEELLKLSLVDNTVPFHVLSGHLTQTSSIAAPSLVHKLTSDTEMATTAHFATAVIPDAARIHSTVAKTTAGASINLPPRLPVFNTGLKKLFGAEALGSGRYYDTPLLENDYKTRLDANPTNVSLWMEYAGAMIPNDLNIDSLDGASIKLTKALNVLTRALEIKGNQNSELLWNLYLELLSRKGADKEFRTMCQKAVQTLGANSTRIYWRWYMWARDKADCENVLRLMLKDFGDKHYASLDEEDRSQIILDIVIQRAQNCIQSGREGDAAAWLHRFLTESSVASILSYEMDFESLHSSLPLPLPTSISSSVASRWLSFKDLSYCWLFLLHLLYFGDLPSALFHPYPYDYVIRKDFYFVIDWSSASVPANAPVDLIEDLLRIVVTECRPLVQMENRHPYVALRYNYVALLRHRNRHISQIMEEIGGERDIEFPELADLFVTVLTGEEDYDVAVSMVETLASQLPAPALWNRLARLHVDSNNVLEAMRALINGAAAYVAPSSKAVYQVDGPFESRAIAQVPAEMALNVYCTLLGITFQSTVEISLRQEISRVATKSDLFAWLNFLMLYNLSLDGSELPKTNEFLQDALAQVVDRAERCILWTEIISHESHSQSDPVKAVTTALGRALQDMPATLSRHVYGAGAENESDLSMNLPLAIPDFRRRIMAAGLESLPADKRLGMLRVIDEAMPDVAKSVSFVKMLYDAGDLQAARSILHLCLQDAPRTDRLWKLVLAFEFMTGNEPTVKHLLSKARSYLHPESATWKEVREYSALSEL